MVFTFKPPKVYLSASSGDLRTVCRMVAEALDIMEWEPVERPEFDRDYRLMRGRLSRTIRNCDALIHIVGLRYGMEPDPATLPKNVPRQSCAQMAYELGLALQRKRGKHRFRVYTFLCPENFPYDPEPIPETGCKRAQQKLHRQAIVQSGLPFDSPADREDLKKRVLALGEDLLRLEETNRRRRRRLIGAAAVAASLALAGLGIAVHHLWERQTEILTVESRPVQFEVLEEGLRSGIETRFRKRMEVVRSQPGGWGRLYDLERLRHLALERVDDVVASIREDLAGKPDPFLGGLGPLLEQKGLDVTLKYLTRHQSKLLARISQAAEQTQPWSNPLRRHLKPLLLKSALHELCLEPEEAFAILRAMADKAPVEWEPQWRLGNLLRGLGRYDEAEPHLRKALDLASLVKDKAQALSSLGILLSAANRLEEAEPLLRQALALHEDQFGKDHPKVADDLSHLEALLLSTQRLSEAKILAQRALAIDEQHYGPEHIRVATRLDALARVLWATRHSAEAEPLLRRAVSILENRYEPDHPVVAAGLSNLGLLLKEMNLVGEAERTLRRALEITEANYGREHPDVVVTLNSLGLLLHEAKREGEAEPLLRRVLDTSQSVHGPEHQDVAIALHNLSLLLVATGRLDEAEIHSRRMLDILFRLTATTGQRHPNLPGAIRSYALLLSKMGRTELDIKTSLEKLAKPYDLKVSNGL
jgi:tetratricopeptide (TPR) repeat protein